mmetsp:Transcript_56773/g.178256  ORF Transcript_56773/g.178256 Transcript_56773/m.178256 type:complete len:219 (-) Transcript_56773:74-730(-)
MRASRAPYSSERRSATSSCPALMSVPAVAAQEMTARRHQLVSCSLFMRSLDRMAASSSLLCPTTMITGAEAALQAVVWRKSPRPQITPTGRSRSSAEGSIAWRAAATTEPVLRASRRRDRVTAVSSAAMVSVAAWNGITIEPGLHSGGPSSCWTTHTERRALLAASVARGCSMPTVMQVAPTMAGTARAQSLPTPARGGPGGHVPSPQRARRFESRGA